MNKPTILYVDDEPTNLMLFEALLEDDYTVLTAMSGAHGLEIINERNDIQVVFSDMKMPGMNGIDFINKAFNILPNIPYYIVTGFEINNEIQNALDTGIIQKYFKKPVMMDEISKEIKAVLNNN